MIPKIVFIIPYRDREQQLAFFKRHMKYILEDYPENYCKIFFIHQCDNRTFNRGAIKNIGFLFVKDKYPDNYKDITFVFNDIDTLPYTKGFLNYETSKGFVKHFYGLEFALGGIVSITGEDFLLVNGFPNFFGWGFEDNALQKRVLNNKLLIDRSNFFHINNKNIIQFKDEVTRMVNKEDFDIYKNNINEGISSLVDISYVFDENTGFVNINSFNTGRKENTRFTKEYDLRNGPSPFKKKKKMIMLLN
jgi:hypothetical protein